MKGMAERYDPHMWDLMRICVKIWKAITWSNFALLWKSSEILSVSDVADITQLHCENIGKSAQDEELADLLSLMKQRTLDEQAELFIDSEIASITPNDLCEWIDIESIININTER